MRLLNRILLTTAAVCALAPLPAASAYVTAAISGPGHSPAVLIDSGGPLAYVGHTNRAGNWRFLLVPGNSQAVRLASLEGGGGLVAYDQGDVIVARTWGPDGTVAPPQAVLTGIISTWWQGDFQAPEWQMASDDRGTVALASVTTNGRGVLATVRDPGGAFGAVQRLGDTDPVPGVPSFTEYRLAPADMGIGPIGAGGAVTVQWGAHGHGGPGVVRRWEPSSQATRPGPRRPFAAPTSPAAGVTTGAMFRERQKLSAPPVTVVGDQSAAIRVGAGIVRHCGAHADCRTPKPFAWGTTKVILFADGGDWLVAKADARGVYDHPTRVAGVTTGSQPLWTKRHGVVAFASSPGNDPSVKLKRIDVLRAGR
jgi:hypothetical protein